MTLFEFVKNNEVDYSFDRVSESTIIEIEKKLGVCFGTQLKEYILKYGYLGYQYIELFGINNSQGLNSDMVKKTIRLNEHFEKTKGFIAIEDQGDGDYYLVDSKDNVYRFIIANNDLIPYDIDLYGYILDRFLQAANIN